MEKGLGTPSTCFEWALDQEKALHEDLGLLGIGRRRYRRLHEIVDAKSIVIVVVYVDDFSFFTSTLALIIELKARIASIHKFSDIGEVTQFLGLRILCGRKARTILIGQQHAYMYTLGQ